MKIGAVTLALNDEATIAGTIRCCKPFVDKHIVLISEKPYFGETPEPDKTEDICNALGVDVVKGEWELDHFQRTLGNKLCDDCDWVLGLDSDEMLTEEDMKDLLSYLEWVKSPAVAVHPEIYWKTLEYRLRPKPGYTPIIAMKPSVKFTHIRNIDNTYTLWPGTMHHLSWCWPKDIKKKVIHYAHATDFDGEKWFEECYKPWLPGMKAKLPTGEYDTVFKLLPQELNEHLFKKVNDG